MSRLRFKVLGPLEAVGGDGSLELGSPRQQAVLALLLAHANRVVSGDRLIDELWGEEPPAKARHSLQTYVSNLRRIFRGVAPDTEFIETRRPGYVLHVEDDGLDAAIFEASLAAASSDPAEEVRRLAAALSLWRGDPYAGLADEVPSLAAEATRLAELRLTAVERRITAGLASGADDPPVAELERLTAQHPLREGLWAALMLALYRAGRQSEALRAYQRARSTLGEELGIEPSPELRELEERILLQDPALAPEMHGATAPNNLPTLNTEFVGRAVETEELAAALRANRLVTLTGPGGIGKTRLAVELASRRLDGYPDGVYFVDLGSIAGPGFVAQSVRESLGLTDQPGRSPEAGILAFLARKKSLLLLDNCEHVLDETTAIVWSLITRAPGVTILCTSQELLGVEGETAFRLGSIGLEAGESRVSEAAALFMSRAGRLAPGDGESLDDPDAIDTVCRALDGVPLAIELAAARTAELSPREIADRINDRFSLLAADRRTGLSRHTTLREAVEWSYGLLAPEEQAVFNRLAVMIGSFDFEAARAVAGSGSQDDAPLLDVLGSLVRRSLVSRTPGAGKARYRMLQSLREFGREQLRASGELDGAAERYARHFAARVLRTAPALVTRGGADAMRALETDLPNVRAAFDRLLAGDVQAASALNLHLAPFWGWRHHSEGADWSRRVLAAAGLPPAARARTLAVGAWLAYLGGAQRRAEDQAKASLEITAGADLLREPMALSILAACATTDDRPDEAVAHAEEAVSIVTGAGSGGTDAPLFRPHEEFAQVFLGLAYVGAERIREAVDVLEEALATAEERGDRRNMANTRWLLGATLRTIDADRSVAELRTAVAELDSLGVDFDMALAQSALGTSLIQHGDFAEGIRTAVEACRSALRVGDERNLGFTLEILALFVGRAGLTEDAVRLYGAGRARRRATGDLAGFAVQVASRRKARAHLRAALDPEAYAAAWSEGMSTTAAESLRLAETVAARLLAGEPSRPSHRTGPK